MPVQPDGAGDVELVTSADGTEIAVERTGTPLVLVYGNSDVRRFWEAGGVRQALAAVATVYAMERRGRGESGDVEAYELDREADDIIAILEAIDEPATLLGHSGGALYALEAAARTDTLRGLILYEPPIQVGGAELDVDAEIAAVERLVDRDEPERALHMFVRDIPRLPPDEIEEIRSSPVWAEMVDAAPALPRELRAISEYRFDPARFEIVTVPTLLLTGSESPPLYRAATTAVDDALPNSRITTFEGEQHLAMQTAPGRSIDEVRRAVRTTT